MSNLTQKSMFPMIVGLLIVGLIVAAVALQIYLATFVRIVYQPENGNPETFYTKQYREKDGCIEFDSLGGHRKLCGGYRVLTIDKGVH